MNRERYCPLEELKTGAVKGRVGNNGMKKLTGKQKGYNNYDRWLRRSRLDARAASLLSEPKGFLLYSVMRKPGCGHLICEPACTCGKCLLSREGLLVSCTEVIGVDEHTVCYRVEAPLLGSIVRKCLLVPRWSQGILED